MTLDEINDNIRAMVRGLLSLDANYVRPAYQNAPVGAKNEPFATVLIMPVASAGQDYSAFTVDPNNANMLKENIRGTRRLIASINFYRGDAVFMATRLKTLMASSSAIETMQQNGLGYIRASEVRDLTDFVNSLTEARGQIDIEFYAVAGERLSMPTYGRFPIAVDNSDNTQSLEVHEP